jgi:predicted metal-binding membrane protein
MTMKTTQSYPMSRERNLILALLIILAAAAWGLLIWQQSLMSGEGTGSAMGMDQMSGMEQAQVAELSLTMGMGALLFMAMWVAMMVAMMFPTAAPMILTFARVHSGRRQKGQSFVPTWVFVSGYLVVWAVFGVLAYVAAVGIEALARQSMWVVDNAARLGGVVLVLAGVYQLSPLKNSCLSKCRSPLQFILGSWRDGYGGSFRMGLEHGIYCLGCCWLLFVILFPLGIMNVAAMAVITLLIFAEKSLPVGRRIGQIASVALIVYGLLALFIPELLPVMKVVQS